MKKIIAVEHVYREVESDFDSFTSHLEKELGVLMPSMLRAIGASPAAVVSHLNPTCNESNLILFNILFQDDLTKKENRRKIKQYQVGNPRIMLRMMQNHPGTGLYIPIHLLVYEKANGKVVVEYDLPSSSFAQFDNTEIILDAITLENKLAKLIQIADGRKDKSIVNSVPYPVGEATHSN